MQAFKRIKALVVPLDRSNVDTDAIIPKQFLKSVQRTGFGQNLFDEWRYQDDGEPGQDCTLRPLREDFPLNQVRYQGAGILLARENFGCGSSREHAVWALSDYGLRVLIAPSFADIFHNNCFKCGLLPIVLPAHQVDVLFRDVQENSGYRLSVDLDAQQVVTPSGQVIAFHIDAFRKQSLLHGLDEIGLTLQEADAIRSYEEQRRQREPWLFGSYK